MPIDNKYRSILWLKEDDIVDLFPSSQDITDQVCKVQTELSTQLNSFQQTVNQQITELRNSTTTQINNVTQTLVDSLGQTRVTGIGSAIESNYIGVVVHVVGYMNLWENGSASYRVYVNNSSNGTINVNWRSQRTGGSGHGYSTAVGNCGYLSANRNIPQGASIRVDRVSASGVVIDKEFATIML